MNRTPVWSIALGCTCLALGLLSGTQAQDLRDPTQPPRLSPAALPSGTTPSEGLTVMVRNGKPFLVVGTRWYGVGEFVGHLRIDRITETEVWMHDSNALLKTPRFAGVTRTATDCESPSSIPSSPGASAATGTIHIKSLSPAPAPKTGASAAAGPARTTVKCTP